MTQAQQREPSEDTYLSLNASTERLSIDGVDFAHRKIGERNNQLPLVLLHRFRATMDDWDPAFLDLLARDRQVIIFDSEGVGYTPGRAPGSIKEMSHVASSFLSALGTPVDVLGWSMGGMVGLELANEYPELLRRLVVAGSTPGGVTNSRQAPQKVWEIATKPVNDDEDFQYLFFNDTDKSRSSGAAHFARLRLRPNHRCAQVPAESVQAQFQAIGMFAQSGGVFDHLKQMTLPVFMTNGVHDVMVHAYASYAAVEQLPKGVCKIYPDSGHGFLFQHYTEFSEDVRCFLNG